MSGVVIGRSSLSGGEELASHDSAGRKVRRQDSISATTATACHCSTAAVKVERHGDIYETVKPARKEWGERTVKTNENDVGRTDFRKDETKNE